MRRLGQRELRLLLIAAVLVCIVPFAPMLNSQFRHLRQVEVHIAAVGPQWEAFKRQNPGFESVQLFAYTDGDGMFGASGEVPTDEHVERLRAFMENTKPPRPVFVEAIQVIDQGAIDYLKALQGDERASATNQGQRGGSETNQRSPATGPGGRP